MLAAFHPLWRSPVLETKHSKAIMFTVEVPITELWLDTWRSKHWPHACEGHPTVGPQGWKDQPRREERREREGESALFAILCSGPVSRASPHCRGNHLVCLTGVARAIRQRA